MVQMLKKTYNPNENIFEEGASGDVAYVLKEGKVEISIKASDEHIVLAVLTPPSIFGEMAVLIEDSKRSATATALEYTELLEVARSDFEAYFRQTPKIIVHMLNAMVARLKNTTEKVSKAPNAFIGICEILGVMSAHGIESFDYETITRCISKALFVEPKLVKERISLMEAFSLIESEGKTSFKILKRDTFINRARKIHQVSGGRF